jgi:hypothetical protein
MCIVESITYILQCYAKLLNIFTRLDVAQHMSLCRHYVRELRRTVMIGTPSIGGSRELRPSFMSNKDSPSLRPREAPDEGDKDSPHLSGITDEETQEPPETPEVVDAARNDGASSELAQTSEAHPVEKQSTTPPLDQRDADEQIVDILLRGGSSGSRPERIRRSLSTMSGDILEYLTRDGDRPYPSFLQRDESESPPRSRASPQRVRRPSSNSHNSRSSAFLGRLGDIDSFVAGPSRTYGTDNEKDQDAQMSAFLREDLGDGVTPPASNSPPNRVSSSNASRSDTVTRAEIRESAEKILYTYLLPGSEREITLPHSITRDVTIGIEEQGRDDPELFDAAKDYVFEAIDRDAFPGFLRMKSLGNLVPPQLLIRRLLGLVCFFAGFWAAFVLIFLDEPRHARIWVHDLILFLV